MMRSNTLFVATPKDRKLLNEEMVRSFKNGMEGGDVTIVTNDAGVVLKAHKCVLSISKFLKGLFQSQEMASLLNITIMIPGFGRKSIMAILQFLYTGEVELVTGSDVTIEFSELCKIFQLNPPVNKYRNHTSKKAKSSLATSNPKYRQATPTSEASEKPSVNRGKSSKPERPDKAPRPSGERHEKSDKVPKPSSVERPEKNPEKSPKSSEKVSEEEKQKDDHQKHEEKGEKSLEPSKIIPKEPTEESSEPIQPEPIEPSPVVDSGVENTPDKNQEEEERTSFKMPDNFDLPDEFVLEGSSMPGYAKPSPIVGYASSPISSPAYGQEDSASLAIEKSFKLPYPSGYGEVKPSNVVEKNKKPLANLKSIFKESEAKKKTDLQKPPANSPERIENPFYIKKQRVAHHSSSHHEPEKSIPVKSAKNELDEKRQRMMRKLRFEEEEKFDEKFDRKKSSKLLGIRLKRKSGGEYISSASKRSHGKRPKKCHRERPKHDFDCDTACKPVMAEDDEWLVDDIPSEESDQWIPSGGSEVEYSGESEISISTSTSSEGDESRSEKERTRKKLKKSKKKKMRRRNSQGYFENDEELVTKAKDLIKAPSREEGKPTEISAERRDLNPGELSLLFQGRERKRVRVKVDMHGQSDMLDMSLYKLKLINGSSSGETDTDVVDKEKSQSDEPGRLTIDESRIKVKKLKKKFNRIQMYNSSSEEDEDGKKESGGAKVVFKRSVSEIQSPMSQDPSGNRHSSSGGSFTFSQASIARWKEDNQKKNITSIKIRPYPPLQTSSSTSKGPSTVPPLQTSSSLSKGPSTAPPPQTSSSSSKGPSTAPPLKFSYGLSSENKALAEKSDPRQNLDSILKMSFKKKPGQNPASTDSASDPTPSTSKPIVKPASVDNHSKVFSSATNDTLKIIKPNSEADKLLQSLEQS